MFFDLVYLVALILGSPFWLWKLATVPRHRHRLGERLARYPDLPPAPAGRVWFHAASMGEVRSLRGILEALARERPGAGVVVTTQTETGWHEARRLYPEAAVLKAPLDLSWTVRRALRRLKPSALVLVESEFWPNLVRSAARRDIPVAVAGGTISERSFRRMSSLPLRPFARAVFPELSRVWAADDAAAERFLDLGTPPGALVAAGSPKFDVPEPVPPPGSEPFLAALRTWKGQGALLVAGSTHEGEEDAMVEAAAQLRRRFALRLVLAPRHPQRFEAAARRLEASGVRFVRRSERRDGALPAEADVCLLDAMGELAAVYPEADAAFVGGSLVPVGGHNVLEPAACGVPSAWGPHARQFAAECRGLAAAGGGVEVADADRLGEVLAVWLSDPVARRRAGEKARRFVVSHRGVSARIARELAGLL